MKAWRVLGGPGLAGLAALLLAAVCGVLGQRLDDQTLALQRENQALRRQLPPPSAASAPLSSAQWQAQLPAARERQQRLADLIEMATRAGLANARTEHRLATSDGIERLRVSMPLSGSYAQLRRFIGAALAHDPALSLDALKIRRANPQAIEVEAELQWSLFGRAP